MSNKKWTEEYVQTRFPAEVRAQRRSEGYDPEEKPTHEWLREHGYIGIQNYADRQDKTVDEVLVDQCGFKPRERKPLPVNHAETEQLIRQWLADEDGEFARWNDVSVGNAWSHMRKWLEISRKALGSTNLLRPARAPSGKNIRLTLQLFRELNTELSSEGARYNYASTLSDFYEYLVLIGEADDNPAEMILPRMGWSYNRSGPGQLLTPQQVRECWQATETLIEKIIILTLAGAGARTGDLQLIAIEDIRLDRTDPVICFGQKRKNGPGTVPIIAGHQYYEAYIQHLEDEGYEMLLPSDRSADGTRSGEWIRDKVEEIVDRAGVRLPNGTKPTPKDFRRFWFNEYAQAYESYLAIIEDVAADQGSVSAEIVEKHYLANHRARDHFRRVVESHFETAFPTDVMLSFEEIMAARADKTENEAQVSLYAFTSA